MNNNNYLLITLGHNSSAIFFNKKTFEVIGYEQERLSAVKTDSQFPQDAINEIMKHVSLDEIQGCKIKISHWFDFDGPSWNKYFTHENFRFLKSISGDIEYCSESFTHHDAHAYSALSFLKYWSVIDRINLDNENFHTLVIDGFGNNGEVLSLYKTDPRIEAQKLIFRIYGYEFSLGLLYQYATSFAGMKENQDEYKFLGYESYIDKYFTKQQIVSLADSAKSYCMHYFDKLSEHGFNQKIPLGVSERTDDPINISKLKKVKDFVYSFFDGIIKEKFPELNGFTCDHDEEKLFKGRVLVGFVTQTIVESIVRKIIKKFNIENICVAGGTFYNVKLNKLVLDSLCGAGKRYFCALPLAGDQGAAIGFLMRDGQIFNWSTLNIGPRNFYNAAKILNGVPNCKYAEVKSVEDLNAVVDDISARLHDNEIVNIVSNSIEFGPRALGGTSTLFIPTAENTSLNNKMNKRNEVMPCAPILLAKNSGFFFSTDELSRVIGSDRFMICTHEYAKVYRYVHNNGSKDSSPFAGVMHKSTLVDDSYTGRPQLVYEDSPFLYKLLSKMNHDYNMPCLVNTSFNVHGRPIVFTLRQIIENFEFQLDHCEENDKKPFLYVINMNISKDEMLKYFSLKE